MELLPRGTKRKPVMSRLSQQRHHLYNLLIILPPILQCSSTIGLTIFGVNNGFHIPDVLGDAEPHLFELCYAKDVRNPFLVEPQFNGTEP